jgi:hypothetical protein
MLQPLPNGLLACTSRLGHARILRKELLTESILESNLRVHRANGQGCRLISCRFSDASLAVARENSQRRDKSSSRLLAKTEGWDLRLG